MDASLLGTRPSSTRVDSAFPFASSKPTVDTWWPFSGVISTSFSIRVRREMRMPLSNLVLSEYRAAANLESPHVRL